MRKKINEHLSTKEHKFLYGKERNNWVDSFKTTISFFQIFYEDKFNSLHYTHKIAGSHELYRSEGIEITYTPDDKEKKRIWRLRLREGNAYVKLNRFVG